MPTGTPIPIPMPKPTAEGALPGRKTLGRTLEEEVPIAEVDAAEPCDRADDFVDDSKADVVKNETLDREVVLACV